MEVNVTENCSRFLVSRDAPDTDLAGWISGQPKKKLDTTDIQPDIW
jgi:hypothetical protein